jgi:glutathione S-transferase
LKLYLSPGACSLAPHIALAEAGLKYEIEKVDLRAKTTKSGQDFWQINAKGGVPALQLDDGQVLTECAAVVQYIADLNPGAELAPPVGTFTRNRLQEWLNYIASELHKGFAPLFNPQTTDDGKKAALTALDVKFDYLAGQLEGKSYLLGTGFTVADGYLFTVLTWTKYVGIDLGKWPSIESYFKGIAARPAVLAVRKAESEI